jgi:hypothetical protein
MRKSFWPICTLVLAIACLLLLSRSEEDRLELIRLRAAAEAGTTRETKERAEIEHLRIQIEGYKSVALAPAIKAGDTGATQAAADSANIDITPFLVKDPAYARLHRQNLLNSLKRQYGDLRSLNLPADQLQRLEDLLIDRNSTLGDAREAAAQAGLKNGSPEYAKAVSDASNEDDDQIKALIGQGGLQGLQDTASLNGAKLRLQFTLGQSLGASGMPLSGDQLSALADIQVKSQNAPADSRDDVFGTAASQVLTPDQYTMYSQNIAFQKDYNDMLQRALAAAKQQYWDIKSWHYSSQ